MAAFNFPDAPSVGDKYPTPSIVGIPTYTWDGEKWTTYGNTFATGAPPSNSDPVMDGTAAPGVSTEYARSDHVHPKDSAKLDKTGGTLTGDLVLAADPDQPMEAATKQYTDTKMKLSGQQTITNGFRFTSYNAGTVSSGNFQPDAYNGNYQYYTNNGAHTWVAPANDCAVDVLITNGAAAGGVTLSGFTIGSNVGDTLTTTNGHRFIISFRRINGISTYVVKALQ
jgi:hypothetical protein